MGGSDVVTEFSRQRQQLRRHGQGSEDGARPETIYADGSLVAAASEGQRLA